MNDELIESSETGSESAQNYIDAINQLKQNSVSRDEYLKLKTQNKQLLDSLVNGNYVQTPVQQKEERPINDIRDDLFNHELNNLDYCKTALELRDRVINEGGQDPFLPQGHQYVIQQSDIDTANRVASVMKECIEYADGDSNLFTQELMRRTNESPRIPRK